MKKFYCIRRWERLCSFLFIFCFLITASHATDISLNTDSKSESLMCVDPPVITCPTDYNGCPGDDTSTAALGSASAVAGGPNCGTPIIGHYDIVFTNGPCNGEIFFKRVWYAYDPSDPSLISDCTQEITLIDNTAPVLTNCPQNVIVAPTTSDCEAIVSWTDPMVTDNCSGVTLSSTHSSGTSFPLGSVTTVIYTATDVCGNASTCSFTISVEGSCCFDPPIITCPTNYSGCPSESTLPSNTGSATASPGGSNCVQPSINYTDNVVSTGPCSGATIIERTWTATDPENPNSQTSCLQTITLSDTTNPMMTSCPLDITDESTDGNCVIINYTPPTATDNCGMSNVSSNFPSGSCFPIGTTNVTYTATDNCGNTATCTFTVTIEDNSCNMPPLLTCPGDYNSCPGTSTDPSITGNATVAPGMPNCGNPNLTYNDLVISSGPCSGATVIERTWTATDPDDSSLVSTCAQLITLSDNTNPTLTSCPTDINLESNDGNCVTGTWSTPIATDNCGTPTLSANFSSGACFPVGMTVVTYTATDDCGNTSTCDFMIIVEDLSCMQGPNLICPADYTHCPGVNNSDPKMTGLPIAFPSGPNCGTPIVTFTDEVISTTACGEETIERTWTATDDSDPSFVTTCVQIISFVDDNNPVLSDCPTDQSLSSIDGDCVNASWTPPTATDACTSVTVTGDYNSGHCFPIGSTIVTYTATDECGNTSTCNFTIVVIDNSCDQPPVITCPNLYNGCPGDITQPSNTGSATATAGGANCGTPTITFDDHVISTNACGETEIERTWTATDPNNSGLTASCTQTIILIDNTDPVMTACPSDIFVDSNDGNCVTVNWTAPSASDNCGSVDLTSNIISGHCFAIGATTVTYTAADPCGNTVTCSFIVTVIDNSCNTPPVITCPTTFIGCPTESVEPSNTGSATAVAGADNCSTPVITYADEYLYPYICEGTFDIQRTWTATDPNNSALSSTCMQIIKIRDIVDPVINCPADILNTNPNGTETVSVTWPTPTSSDDCGIVAVNSTHVPGDMFPVGTTTVSYTVTDACGNTGTCSFIVTVEAPVTLVCPDDQVVSCDGSGGTVITWPEPTFDSNCSDCGAGGNTIPGFIYMGNLNGHEYYCSTSPAVWDNAQATCLANGGHLAVINSEEENNLLASFLVTQSAYIGLSDVQDEGNFTWVNGDPLNYTNWYPNQPNNYNGAQHYVEMLSNGQWNDQYAKIALEFIMEIPCTTITQTCGPTKGSTVAPGTYDICYSGTDGCGNTATCSFTITVEESISITCPNDVTLSCPAGNKGILVNWATPQANSCCSMGNCDSGEAINGFLYMGEYNGSHYYCSNAPATWFDAQATCVANGGHLAIVNDTQENTFLANFLTTQSAYIGLSDHETEGEFKWVNGDALGYTNWYPGQPNNFNGSQHFVELLSNGQWNDQYGKVTLEYIMEIPSCTTVTQTGGPYSGSLFHSNTTTTISYEATDLCGNTAICSFDITIAPASCTSGGQNSKYTFIDQVEFGPINNTSGNNGGYADFSNSCHPVTVGQHCGISLTPGFGAGAYPCYWKIYCDWNQDNDFFDAGEYIAYGSGTGNINGNFTIPSNVWNGDCKLRVVMKYGSYPTGPCETFAHGETEDYCITVSGGEFTNSEVVTRAEIEGTYLEGLFDDEYTEDISLEEMSSFAVKIFPNPASEFITVSLEGEEQVMEVGLFTLDGKRISIPTSRTDNAEVIFNVSNIDNGIYLVKATNGTTSQTKKIVVTH